MYTYIVRNYKYLVRTYSTQTESHIHNIGRLQLIRRHNAVSNTCPSVTILDWGCCLLVLIGQTHEHQQIHGPNIVSPRLTPSHIAPSLHQSISFHVPAHVDPDLDAVTPCAVLLSSNRHLQSLSPLPTHYFPSCYT